MICWTSVRQMLSAHCRCIGEQARAYGADACLLIASVLPNKDLKLLLKVAEKLGLHALIEVLVSSISLLPFMCISI